MFVLGLIRDWAVDRDGHVRIVISPTFPSCVMIGERMEQLERETQRVPGVASVVVELDSDLLWTPDEMTDAGRAWLTDRRETSMREVPVLTLRWREQPPKAISDPHSRREWSATRGA